MKIQHKIALWSVIACVAVWIVDSAINASVFNQRPFLNQLLLFPASPREAYSRFLLIFCLLAFGFMVPWVLRKRITIEENLQSLSTAIESSMDGIAIFNKDGEYVYVNHSYAAVNGYDSPKEIIGKNYRLVYDEQQMERMQSLLFPALLKTGKWRGELVARRKNGSTYFQEASVTMLEDEGRVCIIRDITWRKRSEERQHRSEHFLHTIFDSIRDPFCIFDSQFRIVRTNEAYAQIKGKSSNELIGGKCYEVLERRDSLCDGCVVGKSFDSRDPCAKDKMVRLPDGTEIWVEIYTYPILDDEGNVSHVIEYTRDVTGRKKSEEEKRKLIDRLEYLSRTDALTGLMNRRALSDCLTYEIERAKRYRAELSLILFDVDNFKKINDACGHDAGDRALQTVSAVLKTILRKTDLAGRYGGDEFMLILPETSIDGADSLAEKILSEVRNSVVPVQTGNPVRLSLSIGVTCLTGEIETFDSLVKRADEAMYASKHGGKNRISIMFSDRLPEFKPPAV